MKSTMIFNIASIILGVAASLFYQGLDVPRREKIMDLGTFQVPQKIKKTVLVSSTWRDLVLAGKTLLNILGMEPKNKGF